MRELPVAWLFSLAALGTPPEGWSLSLPGIYAAWAVVLAVLYMPCRWFAGVKAAIPEAGCLTFDPECLRPDAQAGEPANRARRTPYEEKGTGARPITGGDWAAFCIRCERNWAWRGR